MHLKALNILVSNFAHHRMMNDVCVLWLPVTVAWSASINKNISIIVMLVNKLKFGENTNNNV